MTDQGAEWQKWRSRHRALVLLLALLIAQVTQPISVKAHEVRPAVVTLSQDSTGPVRAEIKTNIEALLAGIGPEHKDTANAPEAIRYNALRNLSPTDLQVRFDEFAPVWLRGISLNLDGKPAQLAVVSIAVPAVGDAARARISTVTLAASNSFAAKTIEWSYDRVFGSNVLRVVKQDGTVEEAGWLQDGKSSGALNLVTSTEHKSSLSILAKYAELGFTHIVPKGLDHILFVLGLYFLSIRLRPLLTQVTAFTAAHSITLSLGLFGIVDIPASVVEPLIALSIVYVAVENMLTDRLQVWRPVVVFAFGLLHGLGFAGILLELGLPREEFVTGLIGFNLGVEFGQLFVIAIAWLATGLWFRNKQWYRQRIVVPASLLIAACGLYWTFERLVSAA